VNCVVLVREVVGMADAIGNEQQLHGGSVYDEAIEEAVAALKAAE
jgi:hypothetical protein